MKYPFRIFFFHTAFLGIFLFLLGGCRPSQPNSTLPAEVRSPQQAIPFAQSTQPLSTTAARANPEATISPTVEAGSAILSQSSPTPGREFPWTATPDVRMSPQYWRQYPVIPVLSTRAQDVLTKRISNGNNIHAFSIIGDCQSMPPVFMGIFDQPGSYQLNEDALYLKETVEHFAGASDRAKRIRRGNCFLTAMGKPR